MKLTITYEVQVTVDEDKSADVDTALDIVAKGFDQGASVSEINCEEVEEEDKGSED